MSVTIKIIKISLSHFNIDRTPTINILCTRHEPFTQWFDAKLAEENTCVLVLTANLTDFKFTLN